MAYKVGYYSGPRMLKKVKVGNTGAIVDGDMLVKDAGAESPYFMRATDGDIPAFIAAESCAAPTADGDVEILADYGEEALYCLPVVTGTLAETMEGELCDVGVTGTTIGLDVTAATDSCIRIIEVLTAGAVGTGYALCQIYFNKNASAVA